MGPFAIYYRGLRRKAVLNLLPLGVQDYQGKESITLKKVFLAKLPQGYCFGTYFSEYVNLTKSP